MWELSESGAEGLPWRGGNRADQGVEAECEFSTLPMLVIVPRKRESKSNKTRLNAGAKHLIAIHCGSKQGE
jgi:hypothetical protein